MSDPTQGLYVRAFLVCGAAEARSFPPFDIRGVMHGLDVPAREGEALKLDAIAFVAIERNGDREPHTFRLRFERPDGTHQNAQRIPLPVTVEDSMVFTSPLPLEIPAFVAGTYRVKLPRRQDAPRLKQHVRGGDDLQARVQFGLVELAGLAEVDFVGGNSNDGHARGPRLTPRGQLLGQGRLIGLDAYVVHERPSAFAVAARDRSFARL